MSEKKGCVKMPSITEKIISSHIVEGTMEKGQPIAIHIDQTLTQDATGTMAYLQLEAMNIDKVKTDLSISYIDHNTLQNGFENADDHKYLQSVAMKHGIYFSKAGNGICHQIHLERFAKPFTTLLGSDSHTPTAGAMGALAIGAGGLDVACAMAGRPFHLIMPKIIHVVLHGKLQKSVSSKDIILKILQKLSVKGGIGKILEYGGDGVETLSIPQRATITNMGAELGATSSIFPSDKRTWEFLKKQGRESDYIPLYPDKDAHYDETIEIDLSTLEPMIALPHSPDHVVAVKEVAGLKLDQVAIGSCTNSSYQDLMNVASILNGKHVHPDVSLVVSCGSRQVLCMLAKNNGLATMISAGARILETTCGPCIGMGQAPNSKAISLRTFNRNFLGRSGTLDAKILLSSPETAAASAVAGCICDPRSIDYIPATEPDIFLIDDSMILVPNEEKAKETIVVRGPNIRPLPFNTPLTPIIQKKIMIKVGNNITTDHIAPAGSKVLPYRSNIEKISEFVFMNIKKTFHDDCIKHHGGIIIAGHNYGQGSSREHAALAPMYLGIKVVIAKSFARIHHANLINFGILPLTFLNEHDYDRLDELDELSISNLDELEEGKTVLVKNITKGYSFETTHNLHKLDIETLHAGGTLNLIRKQNETNIVSQ